MDGWPEAFSCKPQSLLVLDLIGTWLGSGLGGFGTKDLGTGLDNFTRSVTPSGSKLAGISKLSVGPLMAKTAYFLCPS